MSLERDAQLINDYKQWAVTRNDTTPEAFMRDRAKDTAFERLEEAIKYVDNISWEDAGGNEWAALDSILKGE